MRPTPLLELAFPADSRIPVMTGAAVPVLSVVRAQGAAKCACTVQSSWQALPKLNSRNNVL
ncbi:hypothetical protein FGL95_11575 [Nocardiaceae bacterium YC2-7]|uniref:Uncharacterized protein n=1 Tax=Antrihabitans stalactiti TaxID=2584121 RepID=A0A848KEV4_9NOCA|nr:hypothetical protein [Antrihabitans stalactiti]